MVYKNFYMFLDSHPWKGKGNDNGVAHHVMLKLMSNAGATCDWCGGVLHGQLTGKCSAEGKIRQTAACMPEARQLLKEYLEYRLQMRMDNQAGRDVGSAEPKRFKDQSPRSKAKAHAEQKFAAYGSEGQGMND